MSVIKLNYGYYIEIDQLNYTLRQKYIGTKRTGELKDAVRTYGYYGDIRAAMKRYIELIQMDKLGEEIYSIEEYINIIEKINKDALISINDALKAFPLKQKHISRDKLLLRL